MRWLVLFLAVGVAAPACPAAAAAEAPPCAAQPGRAVHAVTGDVSGAHEFRESFGPGWTFALVPDAHGWNIRVFDAAGMDLTQLTPPWRGAPNPREILGWHFRNAANTGPNDGSVNAPQERRLFLISLGVSGTGGFKPPPDLAGQTPADSGAMDSEARGMLTVLDYGLADLAPGMKARMTHLKFAACFAWPAATEPQADAAIVRRFAGCGLPPTHRLHAYLSPSALKGDFDGDGSRDIAAAAVRVRDGKRGLVVCRGRAVDLIGFDGVMGELQPAYFEHIDRWALEPRGQASQGAGEGAPPVLRGEGISLAKDDSSSVLVYWDGARFQSYWQGD